MSSVVTSPNDAAPATQPDHSVQSAVIAPQAVRLPIHFFILSVLWLVCGSASLPWLAPRAIRFFYQPGILALTHMFSLGFITSAIMGVMYRYVPALVRRPIPYPRIALLQFSVYTLGVIGMVAHFGFTAWTGLWWAAALVLASIILFALNLFPLLWTGVGRGVAETGMFASTCLLVLAALLGLLMGIEEANGFIFSNLPATLGAHVTLAAVGWVTLTICAASYRFVPAFVLPKRPLPRLALWQIIALVVATAGEASCLLLRTSGTRAWAITIAATLLAYALIMRSLMSSRRMPIDWGMGHAVAGMLWLLASLGLGIATAWLGSWHANGAPFAGALVTAALLGWAGNFILGMSYQLFPGFVVRVRTVMRLPPVTIAEVAMLRPRPFILLAFNFGLIAIVVAFILRAPALGAVGGWFVLGAAVPYTAITCWTLSFAYRQSVPAPVKGVRILSH